MEFNFEGKDSAELFGITPERHESMAKHFADVIVKISDNVADYRCPCDVCKKRENPGLHSGRILKEMLNGITAENEIFYVVYQVDKVYDLIDERIRRKELRDSLDKILNNIFKR